MNRDRVLLVGIDIGPFVGLGSEEDGRTLLPQLAITFPAGTTPSAKVMRDYKVLGTPATLFIRPDGEVIERWNGMLTEDQLNEHMESLVQASRDP